MNENVVQEFSCEQCGMLFEGPIIKFDNKSDWDLHLSLHKKVEKTKESANFFEIEPQVKIISTSLELNVFDASAIVKCNNCGKRFLNKEFLNLHVRSVHEPQKIESQKIDPQNTEPKKIEPPVKRKKPRKKPYKCEFCKKSFVRKTNLDAHLILNIMKDKNNPYKARRHLQNSANLCPIEPPEKRINTSLKPPVSDTSLNCNTCGKTFSKKENLSMHISAAHGRNKPHKCYVCGIRYSLKDTLLTHFKNTLHDKRSINCKYCSRNFTQKEMEIHIANVHEGKEPYMCDICEERFSKKSYLNIHLTLKHEEQKQSK